MWLLCNLSMVSGIPDIRTFQSHVDRNGIAIAVL